MENRSRSVLDAYQTPVTNRNLDNLYSKDIALQNYINESLRDYNRSRDPTTPINMISGVQSPKDIELENDRGAILE
jgi:hypothetical protein